MTGIVASYIGYAITVSRQNSTDRNKQWVCRTNLSLIYRCTGGYKSKSNKSGSKFILSLVFFLYLTTMKAKKIEV